jgi:hypothetical protein
MNQNWERHTPGRRKKKKIKEASNEVPVKHGHWDALQQ